jgi:hypothetical protein
MAGNIMHSTKLSVLSISTIVEEGKLLIKNNEADVNLFDVKWAIESLYTLFMKQTDLAFCKNLLDGLDDEVIYVS